MKHGWLLPLPSPDHGVPPAAFLCLQLLGSASTRTAAGAERGVVGPSGALQPPRVVLSTMQERRSLPAGHTGGPSRAVLCPHGRGCMGRAVAICGPAVRELFPGTAMGSFGAKHTREAFSGGPLGGLWVP